MLLARAIESTADYKIHDRKDEIRAGLAREWKGVATDPRIGTALPTNGFWLPQSDEVIT